MKRAITLSSFIVLAACARSPDSIVATDFPASAYASLTCDQLITESARIDDKLAVATKKQRTAQANDIAGVILIGVPVSSVLGGDAETEISLMKGQKTAVAKAAAERSCTIPEKVEQPVTAQRSAPIPPPPSAAKQPISPVACGLAPTGCLNQ